MQEIKTICCNATWTRKSRAHFICDKCGNDVTIVVVLQYLAENPELIDNQ